MICKVSFLCKCVSVPLPWSAMALPAQVWVGALCMCGAMWLTSFGVPAAAPHATQPRILTTLDSLYWGVYRVRVSQFTMKHLSCTCFHIMCKQSVKSSRDGGVPY